MYIATCFDSESLSGYSLNHTVDTSSIRSQNVHRYWRTYDLVQQIAWWWLLRVETCSYIHNLTTINRCGWLKLYIPRNLLTHSLILWRRVLLEKLTLSQLVKKFSAFYGNPKIHYRIHNSCPYREPDQAIPYPHPTHYLKIILTFKNCASYI